MSRFVGNTSMVKGESSDKFDGWMPKETPFIHTNANISRCRSRFNVKSGYAYDAIGARDGFSYGTERKLYHASGYGIVIDSVWIGKSEE